MKMIKFQFNSLLVLVSVVTISALFIIPSMATSSEEEGKRNPQSHNIMRFGRTAGHNIMRFGRAGHNIMHFGKRSGFIPEYMSMGDGDQWSNGPLDSESDNGGYGMADSPIAPLYVPNARSSLVPSHSRVIADPELTLSLPDPSKRLTWSSSSARYLMPHLFLSSLYSPVPRTDQPYVTPASALPHRRYPSFGAYNKKDARDRDNVFMHFG